MSMSRKWWRNGEGCETKKVHAVGRSLKRKVWDSKIDSMTSGYLRDCQRRLLHRTRGWGSCIFLQTRIAAMKWGVRRRRRLSVSSLSSHLQ